VVNSQLKVWVTGARPRTLSAAVAPVLVASALAGSNFDFLPALLALIVSLALQIGVNYANDYSDGVRGTDDERVGPVRITAGGLASAHVVKRAALIAFAIAGVAGFVLALLSSWWLIPVGAASIAAAWGYTGGEKPYGYLGLGELFVFVFFGLVATVGSYYVQTGEISAQSILAGCIMGSLASAILVINNIRDRQQDALVGKNTLAVRIGDRGSRALFTTFVIAPYLLSLGFLNYWVALTLVTLPVSIKLLRSLWSGLQGRELIALLGQTGRLQLLFSLTLTIAVIIG
jgi:1,4-dihydroxy-2-naphthoate octaprenyltransferase